MSKELNMKSFKITSTNKTNILFESVFPSFKDCLETAVEKGIDLSHADLSNKNLTNANLDDAVLEFADLSGSNLTGANLSEANLYASNFSYASLYNTCFAYSDMQHCRFDFASFGATDFTNSNLSFSYFAGLSCFYQDYMHVKSMENCVFGTHEGEMFECSEPPVVLLGAYCRPMIFTNEKENFMEDKLA